MVADHPLPPDPGVVIPARDATLQQQFGRIGLAARHKDGAADEISGAPSRGGLLQVDGLSTTVMRVAAAPGRFMHDLKKLIRTIPDHPKPGIMFRDVTTLLGDAQGFKAAIARMAEPYRTEPVDAVAGIEARGFILGGAIADRLGCAFIPMRKKGRLPWKTINQEYVLEYGVDAIEIHEDAIDADERILIVDDLIATGGTAEAAVKLVRRLRGHVIGAAFIIDLPELGGRKLIEAMGVNCHVLMEFEGH
jgi:adenine phosphoribosyltransferase